MSYIRCLSNPEGLYIIWHVDGYISVMGNVQSGTCCAVEDFEKCLRETEKYGWDHIVVTPTATVRPYKRQPFGKVELVCANPKTGEIYKPIRMWHVTWAYLCRHKTSRARLRKMLKGVQS